MASFLAACAESARTLVVALMLSSLLLLPIGATLTFQSPLLEERQSTALSINIPATAPSDASDLVPHDFPAFAFSHHSFHQYAGNKSSPNVFSWNLINSIAQKTGTGVHVRVGGTSGDFSVYDPNMRIAVSPEARPGQIPKGIRKGPVWYEGFANWPGVKWTYMTPLANDSAGMLQNSVDGTKEFFKNVPSGDFEALEVGNEINFYRGYNRPKSYTVERYLSEWRKHTQAIRTQVFDGGNPRIFQSPVFFGNNCPWCVKNAFARGQNEDGNIKSVALHNYMDGSDHVTLQGSYMNHTRVKQKLEVYRKPVNFLRKNFPDIPLHAGEDNSNTYSKNNYHKLGTFGNALWLVDYLLYAATLNVKRVNVQQSTSPAWASWRAIEYYGKPAAVLPPYYAHPFVADVIGNGLKVRLYDIPNLGDLFAAYGAYDTDNAIKRIVLINFQLYNASSGTRPTKRVTIDLGNSYAGTVRVEKLTAPGGDVQDASEISWKGTSWTKASNGKPVQRTSTTTNVRGSEGRIGPVTVRASEAVLLTLS